MRVEEGQVLARLDLLTSQAHHANYFSGIDVTLSPQPIPGAEIAFAQNEVRSVGDGEVKVAGIVAFGGEGMGNEGFRPVVVAGAMRFRSRGD